MPRRKSTVQAVPDIKEAIAYVPQPGDFRNARFRAFVETYYDTQAYRISLGNRLRTARVPIEGVDIHVLEHWEELLVKQLHTLLQNDPVYRRLVSVRGIGTVLAAGLLAWLDPVPHWSNCTIAKVNERCAEPAGGFERYNRNGPPFCAHARWIDPKHPSSFWRYAGYHVVKEADGTTHAARRMVGVRGDWNTRLHTHCFKVGDSFIKHNTPIYRTIYDEMKQVYLSRFEAMPEVERPRGWKAIADRRASHYMIKQFLVDLWVVWRECEGLPTTSQYSVDVLHHRPWPNGIKYAWDNKERDGAKPIIRERVKFKD
ncbi:MAG: hypothetical protein QXT84_06205 [Candidatus Bathyarchaeia archaeon]